MSKFLFFMVFFYVALEAWSFTISHGESFIQESPVRIGTCYLGATLNVIRITSNTTKASDPLITICHDESTGFTLWSKHIIYGELLSGAGGGGHRTLFNQAGFHANISVDECYKQRTQTDTVAMLLKNTTLARHYIQTQKQLFFARGHLAPNGDQISPTGKNATFYFINASPQWQTINGGNWNQLENQLRKIASHSKSTLMVWTGSYGIMTLDDVNENPVEIWLGRDADGNLVKQLPVNHLTWKVIHDPATRTGVAIIMINNPWLKMITDADILCDDVCDQIGWVNWNRTDIVKGYTYCCTVNTFKEKVSYAPELGDLALMRSL